MRAYNSTLFGLLLAILMFMPIPLTMINGTTNPTSSLNDLSLPELKVGKAPMVPGPDLVESNWTSNRLQNPDYEDWLDPTDCAGWDVLTSSDRYQWAAQSPHPVNEGTYSCGMQIRDTIMTADIILKQNMIGADFYNLTLSFDWYLDQVADSSVDFFRLDLEIIDTGPGADYNIHYHLNETAIGFINTSLVGHYIINDTPHQWNIFSRNITDDFVQIPTFPGNVWSTLELDEINLWLRAASQTSTYLRAYVDDVRLINATDNHEWINGSVRNGNFESGDLTWWDLINPNMDQGFIGSSTTAASGTFSANVTAYSLGNESFVDFFNAPEARLTSLNPGILKFQWRLSLQNPIINTTAAIHLRCNDGTTTVHIYYLLTYYGPFSPHSNSSTQLVLRADNFNSTGSWYTFERNLWNDATGFFSGVEIHVDSLWVEVRAWGPDSRTELLVDQTGLRAATVNGGGFEDQPAVGQEIRGWYRTRPTLLVTDETPPDGGSKAANLTLPSGSFSLYQTLQWRPLNSTRETYLDVMWNINDTVVANQFWIELRVTDRTNYWSLNYYMNGPFDGSNSTISREAHFNVTGSGTTGSWLQMHRDLKRDYESVFGALPDLEMYRLYLQADTAGGGRLEILFDDLYIYDDPAPIITNVAQDPADPGINQPVNVTADVVDQDLTLVELDYRVYTGSWSGWTNIVMDHLSGDTYNATIPGQVSGAIVQYNISATDEWGMKTVSLDNGSPWSYTVADVDPPSINSVDHHPSTVRYTNPVEVTANVTDGGLISSVELNYTTDSWATSNILVMVHTTGDMYNTTIPAQSYGTTVQYYINATDSADNWTVEDNGGSYFSYTVIDDIDPDIRDVGYSPDPAEYDDVTITISCNVTDPGSGVTAVTLYYSTDGWGSSNSMPMTGTEIYTADLTGPFAWNTVILYNISATDGATNSILDDNSGLSYSITIEDNTDPEITNVGYSPDPVEYDDDPITVTCDVADVGSGVASVTLYYSTNGGTSWTPVAMTGTGTYTGDIPGQSWGTTVLFNISATDGAGNTVIHSDSFIVEDNTNPEISGVGHSPDPVEYDDDPITVTCTATDAGSGIATVVLNYTTDGWATWNTVAMTGVGTYSGNIPGQAYDTTVDYYIIVTDSASNWVTSGITSFTVQDNTNPIISNVDHSPDPVEYDDDPITVTCDVADPGSGVSSVTLYYSTNGWATWNTVAMTGVGTYSGNIPGQAYGTTVLYNISAADGAGNTILDDFGGLSYSFDVEDNTDPEITNIGHSPDPVEYDDDPITVTCDVADPGSGVDTVTLYYSTNGGASWTPVTMTGVGTYSGDIPGQAYSTTIDYYITATDQAGNGATSGTTSFTVQDNTPPDITEITRTPSVVLPSTTPLIGCNVSDAGTSVDTVVLYYSPDGWTNTYTISMSFVSGDHYEATLPAYSFGTLVQYYINATDILGNIGLSGVDSYTVGDDVPPEVTNVDHSPDPVEYSDDITFSCEATDMGSGIDTVTLYYRMNGGSWQSLVMSPTTGDTYEVVVSALAWNTFVEYYVNATDNGGLEVRNDNGGSFYSFTVVDNTDPLIGNVVQTPISVNYTVSPLVDCDASDPGSGISVVRLYYRFGGGTWSSVVMTYAGGVLYQASIPAQTWNTLVEYYVNATDDAGNWAVDDNTGAYYSYTVSDSVDPVISAIHPAPASVEYSDTPTVGCDVSDAGSGILSAIINYSVDGSAWTTLSMSFVSGTRYEASLPAQAWGAQVEYYINVTDNAGNWVMDDNSGSYYSYNVVDTTNPSVSITSPDVDAIVAGIISIEMSATDPGSGITRIEIFVDGSEIVELTSQPYSYSWNTSLVLDGAHTISVTAYDGAGNQASDSIDIIVLNVPTPPPPFPGFPIEAIVIALIIAIVGVLLYRRRRKEH